jgi:hypothetical protein
MQSLQHDVAWETAQAVTALAPATLSDDERKELFAKVYDALMAMLRDYEERAERRMKRLGRN